MVPPKKVRPLCKGGCGATPTRYSKTGYCGACNDAQMRATRTKPKATATDTLEVSGNTATQTTLTAERVQTLDDLVRVCGIDLDEWRVERWVANKWEMGAKDATGETTVTPLFQVKAWLVRNTEVLTAKTRIADLVADASQRIVFKRPAVVRIQAGEHCLVLAVPDLHLGKLAWSPETGYADYDLKIAERVFEDAVAALLARTSAFRPAQIVLPVGNDFFHTDTIAATTTRGTPLDTDSRYHKMYLTGRRLLVRTIERLRLVAPVLVPIVGGNHDTLGAFLVGDALECWFRNDPEVTILNTPIPRKYYRYGATAIMWTHGHTGKAADYPLLFATEQPEMFAVARFREVHTGHLHQVRLTEKMGVKVRVSAALCSPDAWHSENHFVGNTRGAEALVYHQTEGLVSVAHYAVPEEVQ